jgi:hypothetical protein
VKKAELCDLKHTKSVSFENQNLITIFEQCDHITSNKISKREREKFPKFDVGKFVTKFQLKKDCIDLNQIVLLSVFPFPL